ncbi:Mob1/phocein [Ampelomyces quisqualis]|uniref:Mob1/phocein n=1 Tax=Ampelomyces quisqualis TaxID=50730 RepID=A0A6A5QE39_AMPQU|nr:Mob1/phocein [Ampelomyces quisqualis]
MASPASPRLPSPPPIPEDQLSPVAASPEQQKLFDNLDHNAARRIRPGTKAEHMAEGPPLVDLLEIDSAFQLTEHLKALHNFLTHPIASEGTVAVDRDRALKLAEPPENVDKTLWLYELCRFLIQKVNSIIVALFSDSPPCSSVTCPEMRASEWQYLCAVHDPPKSCCAIDYCCHTLDWAANTLTSPKHFPSRLALGTDQSTQHSQARQLTNIFRRVYRIFAHAWFQHRDMFWNVEARTGLYVFFKTVCDYYGLIPDDNYMIPQEAEGIEPPTESRSSMPSLILRREPSVPGTEDKNATTMDAITDNSLSTPGTTKRHRHSPSVGATIVSTVVEENEEEEEQPKELTRSVTQPSETSPAENYRSQSEEAQPSSEEAEGEAEDEVAKPVPAAPKADAADDEPEKQGVSVEAKADPTAQSDEKQSDDAEHVPSTTDEADAADANVCDSKTEAAREMEVEPKESREVPIADESAATAVESEKAMADTKSAANPDDAPAEEEASEK